MKTIEDLALEVANGYQVIAAELMTDEIKEFAKRLIEAWQVQQSQEPVGVITWLEGMCCFEPTEGNEYPVEFTELFLAPAIPDHMDVLGRSMVWTSASNPPDMLMTEYGWAMSEPVLGITKHGKMQVVFYEQVDDDCVPRWKTDCSEGWDVTQELTHWMHLPQPPAQGEKE